MPLAEPRNKNYSAVVVELSQFVPLAGCDNVKAAIIHNSSVIVSKDAKVGDRGLFFPTETALSKEFLGANNLFRQAEYGNVDPASKGGFFEEHGRVKTMRFRGHKSEGFFIPMSCLLYILADLQQGQSLALNVGDTFDVLGEHEICRKYVPKRTYAQGNGDKLAGVTGPKLADKIVDGQFSLHTDTENFRRNNHKVRMTDIITITDKWHGTSAVFAKPLVKKELNWFQRLLVKLGVDLKDTAYGLTYSSRKAVKYVDGAKKGGKDFYSSDIWGDVAASISDKIPAGFSLYGEIVGFTKDGSPIQRTGGKVYAYGCAPHTHKFVVYRVTSTSPEGFVIELSWPQLKEFCAKFGLETVREIYYGKAADFCWVVSEGDPESYDPRSWSSDLLHMMEKKLVDDSDCPYNEPGTPSEGIVIRVDRLQECEQFKLKNWRFLMAETKSLDAGEIDIETGEAERLDVEVEAA